jgi:hypothetical protein
VIAQASPTREASQDDNELFLAMLPAIERHAQHFFCGRPPEQREELVARTVALAYSMFVRLVNRGKSDVAYPSPLAIYACRQVLAGRSLGTRMNVRDVTSRYCQHRKGVHVERLDRFDEKEGTWREILVEDRRSTPADIAAARIDVPSFFATLTPRSRLMAEALAGGESTAGVAKQFRVSAARISRLRRQLHEKWLPFHGEAVPQVSALSAAC